MDELAIGVDIGGTKIALALVDRAGRVLAERRMPTRPEGGLDAVLDHLAAALRALLADAPGTVVGIGVGSPGHVDPVGGVVHYAVNLGWQDVLLRAGIQARLDRALPVAVHKDTNAAALGERYFGAAQGCQDFVYLAIGTGLGGAAIVGGQLATGLNAYAMEVGHLVLAPGGRPCRCGMSGCAETYVSGVGLTAGVEAHRATFPTSKLAARGAEVTTRDILTAFGADDPLAAVVMGEAAEMLGAVMACCASLLNPACFVLGGGLGLAASRYWIEQGGAAFRRLVLPAAREGVGILPAANANSAVGASALVWHEREVG